MQIVKVQYLDPVTGQYFSREYSYLSEDVLQIGDIVNVPVRDTTGKAKVSSINVPESEIEAFKDKVKTIPAGSIVKDEVEADWKEMKPLGPLFDSRSPEEIVQDGDGKISTGDNMSQNVPADTTAIVKIGPETDQAFVSLRSEVESLAKYAASRTIKTVEDIKAANDDIVLIGKISKAVEDLRKSYVGPLNDHVRAINLTFKQLSEPLEMADKITDDKILTYRREAMKKQQEAEAINRQKEELARKEAEFNGTGEVTINTEPVVVPEVFKNVKTETGTLGIRRTRRARVIDFAALDDMYKLANQRLLDTAASTGVEKVNGVEFYWEESITHRSR